MLKFLDKTGLDTLWAKIKAKITAAIQALDVSSVGGDGKYISAISETDGKISATATTMDTTPTANSTKAVTSGGIKTALDGKFDRYGFFSESDGKWIGAALSVSGETEVKYWKLCSFTTGNYWTLNFVADVTNAKFDSNVFERKIIAIHGNNPGVVYSALEIREGNNRLYSSRGYGNIIYYETSGNNVTIYIKAKFAANAAQYCRLVSVLSVFSISNLTWYQETTAGTQPENPVKFSLGYKTVKPAGSTSVPVYIGSDGNPTPCTDDFVHDGDVTSTYSSTGTAPVNGTAVAAAIGGLDVSSVGGDGKYISAISETDGKISATATTMDTTPTENSKKAVTSGGIKAALDGKSSTSHAHDDRYIRAGSGNKSLSFGGTTTLGTVSGVNVNLVMPEANADTYEVMVNSTSFADALTAFNSNKKLILKVGKAGSGAYSTAYYLPLYRVQFNGSDITQFVWMLDSDAYGDASGSNTYGAIYIYKLSESGWSSSSDNVEYAKTAGTANGGVADYLKFQNYSEINFKNNSTTKYKDQVWFNYRNGDTDAAQPDNPIKDYYFGDRNKGTNTTLHANRLVGSADKWNGWSIVVGSTGSDANTLYFV